MPDWLKDPAYPLTPTIQRRLYKSYGAYEASKLESHIALHAFAQDCKLPLTSVHPGVVIGSSKTGEASQSLGLGDIVERLWRGKLPMLAGREETFVPLVAVDYLFDASQRLPVAYQGQVPPRGENQKRLSARVEYDLVADSYR